MIPLYHVGTASPGGLRPCNGIAIYLRRAMPTDPPQELPADNVVLANGHGPQRGAWVHCQACGQPIHPIFLSTRRPAAPSVGVM